MRVFVAVELPEVVRHGLHEGTGLLRRSNPAVRWVPPDNMHITLKFLGEITEDRAARVREAVTAVAVKHRPFQVALRSVGGFPNLNRPRVVWVGLREGAEPLATLAAEADSALEAEGFLREKRPFRAHVTVGRCRRPAPLTAASSAVVPNDMFFVDRVVVMQSHLRPRGARYEVIGMCPLSGQGPG
jgi:2'-5' RNA ligase